MFLSNININIFIHDNNGVTDQPIIAFEHYMIKMSMLYRKTPIITKNQYFKGIPSIILLHDIYNKKCLPKQSRVG